MKKIKILKNVEELADKVFKEILEGNYDNGDKILIYGDSGVGKTTALKLIKDKIDDYSKDFCDMRKKPVLGVCLNRKCKDGYYENMAEKRKNLSISNNLSAAYKTIIFSPMGYNDYDSMADAFIKHFAEMYVEGITSRKVGIILKELCSSVAIELGHGASNVKFALDAKKNIPIYDYFDRKFDTILEDILTCGYFCKGSKVNRRNRLIIFIDDLDRCRTDRAYLFFHHLMDVMHLIGDRCIFVWALNKDKLIKDIDAKQDSSDELRKGSAIDDYINRLFLYQHNLGNDVKSCEAWIKEHGYSNQEDFAKAGRYNPRVCIKLMEFYKKYENNDTENKSLNRFISEIAGFYNRQIYNMDVEKAVQSLSETDPEGKKTVTSELFSILETENRRNIDDFLALSWKYNRNLPKSDS